MKHMDWFEIRINIWGIYATQRCTYSKNGFMYATNECSHATNGFGYAKKKIHIHTWLDKPHVYADIQT